MTVHLTKYFGIHIRRMMGADDKPYLTAVIWYPVSRRELSYLYPSMRWF